jgi:hypothetical protein
MFVKTSQTALENKLKNTRKNDGSRHSLMQINNICDNISSVFGKPGICSPFPVEANRFCLCVMLGSYSGLSEENSGLLGCDAVLLVPGVSEERDAVILRVKQSSGFA